MSVLLSPVEAPAWAGGCGSVKNRPHCRPSPTEYRAFLAALGTRYSGSFEGLPRVSRWSVWNEPNQSNWLYPQRERVHGHIVPTAAIIYRNLFRGATAALKAPATAAIRSCSPRRPRSGAPRGRCGSASSLRSSSTRAFSASTRAGAS